jgi:hypothetical protein
MSLTDRDVSRLREALTGPNPVPLSACERGRFRAIKQIASGDEAWLIDKAVDLPPPAGAFSQQRPDTTPQWEATR